MLRTGPRGRRTGVLRTTPRRDALARRLALAVATASLVATTSLASAQDGGQRMRSEIVRGTLAPQPMDYFEGDDAGQNIVITPEDKALIPGIAVRQHPVNVGLFDSGCGQCHRLSGPLPPGADAPRDVFDLMRVEAVDATVPDGFTRLTRSDAREEYPTWSPDGGTIAFEVARDGGRYELWLMNADGTSQRRIGDHASAGWAHWHPSGERLVYWAAEEDGTSDLWVHDVASGRDERLTNHRATAWPTWSPDGAWIAYQAFDERWSLRLLNVAEGRVYDLTQPADTLPSRPLWSPDGTALLYQTLVAKGFELTRLLFATDADGVPDYEAPARRIATTKYHPIDLGAASAHPAWSPTSDRIAFLMYVPDTLPGGEFVLTYKTWTTAPDGTDPTLVVPTGTLGDRSPTWSPDGRWLAQWSWNTDWRAGIWLIEANGACRREITEALGGDALYPTWSPDAHRIAFASNRSGDFDIWTVNVSRWTCESEDGAGR